MTRYLLDANAVIAMLRDRASRPARRARQQMLEDVAISAIVAHELFFGAFKSRRATDNVALVDALRFPVVEFDEEDARKAGEIRALLSAMGMAIGPYDVLIAGQAIARDMILVTHNLQEFERVPGLRIEDWEA
jgi:tRNA(fMet)-specific endonuclease VapC